MTRRWRNWPPAYRYTRIAPAVPRAQHMPSHIFTRLGLWESIQSNELHDHGQKYAAKTRMKGFGTNNSCHGLSVYAALQCAQDDKARSVWTNFGRLAGQCRKPKVAYPVVAIPARTR
jgi:hypothetical protein